MSSRALRKAQRLREEEAQAKQTPAAVGVGEADEEDEEEESTTRAKPSLFAMLNDADEELDEGDEDEQQSDEAPAAAENVKSKPAPARRKKKKGRAGAKKAADNSKKDSKGTAEKQKLDDIDLALRSLATAGDKRQDSTKPDDTTPHIDPELERLSSLLSVDTQHLNVANEMRRLFGRAALDRDEPQGGAAPAQGARRQRRAGQQQQMGLAGAVAGQNLTGGRGLAGLGLRRNIFISGKEEWPRGSGGGLGMELVAQEDDGFTEYRFVHNRSYQEVQSQFETCVESMDPQRMVQLLQFNPYHISTLLQVSEIARQERDHSTAGDLLERGLFSFGRAVHSTFASRLAKGKAGLDFRRPENREFFLAAWRYVSNVGMRGTWRTAFEWAKLVLSLDPEGDPYRMRLYIDQLALRARQPQQLVDLHASKLYQSDPASAPNILFSLALAHQALDAASDSPRRILFQALTAQPWAFARLYKELNLDPAPPSIWGATPRTERETLFAELYATRAKDLWATPEATALLVEVAGISESALTPGGIDLEPISAHEARHVMLTDTPALISLLPRQLTQRAGLVSDPVPPTDSLPSYTTMTSAELSRHEAHAEEEDGDDVSRGLIASVNGPQGGVVRSIISRLLPWLPSPRPSADADSTGVAEGSISTNADHDAGGEAPNEPSAEQLLEMLQAALNTDEVSGGEVENALVERMREIDALLVADNERLEQNVRRRADEMRALGLVEGAERASDEEHGGGNRTEEH